jgi:hypothetical protein
VPPARMALATVRQVYVGRRGQGLKPPAPTVAPSLRDAPGVPRLESRSDGTMVDVDFSPRPPTLVSYSTTMELVGARAPVPSS